MKNKFPKEEGWMRLTITMMSKKPHSEEKLKRIASMGKPDEYEWGSVEQYGAKVKVIFREACSSNAKI
ncbi:MAG: hypothetical protein QM680_01025 [Luteolibacter sp.]